MDTTTIVAIATPPGRGGVGIVRLSGKKACLIATQLAHVTVLNPRKAQYLAFYDESHEVVDQGILLYFKAFCFASSTATTPPYDQPARMISCSINSLLN